MKIKITLPDATDPGKHALVESRFRNTTTTIARLDHADASVELDLADGEQLIVTEGGAE
jgi:hypothetical protein